MYAHTGDIPDVEVKPPAEVLFICKLNPVTTDADLGTYVCTSIYRYTHVYILYLYNSIIFIIFIFIIHIYIYYTHIIYIYICIIHIYTRLTWIHYTLVYIHTRHTHNITYTPILYNRANILPLRSDQRMCNNKRQQNRYSKVIPPHYNSHNYDP